MKNLLQILLLGLGAYEGLTAEPGLMISLGPLAALGISLGASLLSGAFGARGARDQARAIERANEPKPFWENRRQTPWGPAATPLEAAITEALAIHRRNVAGPPPPRISTAGIRGASSNLRDIANAMRERALTSQFIPSAQTRALELMSGPNPMIQSTFNRAQGYTNPLLEMLQARALGSSGGPGAFNTAYAPMTTFLQNLMGGQRQLGTPITETEARYGP